MADLGVGIGVMRCLAPVTLLNIRYYREYLTKRREVVAALCAFTHTSVAQLDGQKIEHPPHVSVCPPDLLDPFFFLSLVAGSARSMLAMASSFNIFLFLFVIF